MKVIKFVFSSFWTFIGTYILLYMVGNGIYNIVQLLVK